MFEKWKAKRIKKQKHKLVMHDIEPAFTIKETCDPYMNEYKKKGCRPCTLLWILGQKD